jgi:hypothetical protein
MQENQKVLVKGADGTERALVLVRIEHGTAYVCSEARYEEALSHPEACIEVGFPVGDVRPLKVG